MPSTQTRATSAQVPGSEAGAALFRRAIIDRDEQAWAQLYQELLPQVQTWISLEVREQPQLVCHEEVMPLVNATFARFAQSVTPTKLERFAQLPALLKHLKLCASSVVADEARAAAQWQKEETYVRRESEPDVFGDVSSLLVLRLANQGLWRAVGDELHGEDERIQVRLGFIGGLKPHEISALYPQFFPRGARDVTRVRRNVLSRLRRSHRLRHYLLQHGYLTRHSEQGAIEESDTFEREAPGAGSRADGSPYLVGERHLGGTRGSERRGGMARKRLEDLTDVCLAHLYQYLELCDGQLIIILAEDATQAGVRALSALVNGCAYQLTWRERAGGTGEVTIRPGRYNHCRDGFSQEAITEALAYQERKRDAVRTVIALEKAAPPRAPYRFGYRVTIDGEPTFIGCFDDESGPVFAPVVEAD
jgi:hypothetical protein